MNAKTGLIGVFWTMLTAWLAVGTTLIANNLQPLDDSSGKTVVHIGFMVPYILGWVAWVIGFKS